MAGFYNCLRGKRDRSRMASELSDVATNQASTNTPDECPGKRRSKFQTFKRLFAKKTQKEAPSPTGVSVLKSNQSTDDINTPKPSLVQSGAGHDSELKANMGNKSKSYDSVFIYDSPSCETNGGLISSQEHFCGKVKTLQPQLQQTISVRSQLALVCPKKGDGTGALSADDGLPHSPPETCTLHTVLAGSSHRLSCDASSRPATPLISLPVDFSQPASPASCLDSSAARHRIAIRHKAFAKRKPVSREMAESSKSKVLCGALGLNKEDLRVGSTEPAAQEQRCKVVQVEQKHTDGDSIEEQGERTEAQHLLCFQQRGEDYGTGVQLSMREEEHSAGQDLSDMGSQHMDMSFLCVHVESKMDAEEILPELVQWPLQTGGWVNDGEPGSLLQVEHTPTVLPVLKAEAEVLESQHECTSEVRLGEGQATPDAPHVEELSTPGPDRASAEKNEEESGECNGEKEVAECRKDQIEEQCSSSEEDEGGEQCLSEDEVEEEEEKEQLEENRMKAEVATEFCQLDSPLLRQEEEKAVMDSADGAGLLSNTYSNSECSSNASLECNMEFSGSVQALEGGKCPPEPPIISSPNSDSVLQCLEETSTTTANVSLRVDSELSTEKHALFKGPEDLRKPQDSPGSKARFTIAPAWQRLLPGGTSNALFFTAPAEPDVSAELPNGSRDPRHKETDKNNEPLHPQNADAPSWPDNAQSAVLLSTLRDHSPQEVGSADNPFGIKLRRTSALLHHSTAGSSEVLGNATPEEPINPPKLPVSQTPSTKWTPLRKADDTTPKVKKTPELALDAPERKLPTPSWLSAARQKQKVFENSSLEETPGRESAFEVQIERQRKISLPISLDQTNKERSKPSSSPLTGISCSREISRSVTVEEGKRALSHSPSLLLSQEPPWLALAKKKAKAWSEMPQIVQ